MGNFVTSISVALILLGLLSIQAQQQRKKKENPSSAASPLTLVQIEQLVGTGAPDEAIAQEIANRGIVFVPSDADIERLKAHRAGPLTVSAITAKSPRAPRANLQITSDPAECEVLLDGVARGHTDQSGSIIIGGVKPGKHVLILKHARPQQRDIEATVVTGDNHISATLNWESGFLTVAPSAKVAEIVIDRLGRSRIQCERLGVCTRSLCSQDLLSTVHGSHEGSGSDAGTHDRTRSNHGDQRSSGSKSGS
jgi:hypothetical protein